MNYTTSGFCNDGVPLEKQEQIKAIIEYFDFERVHKVMHSLDWKIYGDLDLPSYGRLVNLASDLLHQAYSEAVRAYNTPVVEIATNGFCAIARRFDSDIYLELSFVVTSADIRDLI